MKMMWGDQEIPVKNLEYSIDKSADDDVPAGLDLALSRQVEVNFTIMLDYYKVIYLASMMERHNPKKARKLLRRFEYLNPLRLVGLL